MANIDVTIEFTIEWFKEEPTLQPCDNCGDTIFGNTNSLYLFYGFKLLENPVLQICDSCCPDLKDKK